MFNNKSLSIILLSLVVFTSFSQDKFLSRTVNGVKISFYENEIPSGNHPLIYLYVGTLGVKPFKLFITSVNSNIVTGYSVTGNSKVPFTGTFKSKDTTYLFDIGTEEQLKENTPLKIKGLVYSLYLVEPKNSNKNGKFSLVIFNRDAMGSEGNGKWVSYDKTLNRNIILQGAIEP